MLYPLSYEGFAAKLPVGQDAPEVVERGDHGELAHLVALAGEAQMSDLVEIRSDHADIQRADGLTVLLVGPGDAGERQPDVGAEPLADTRVPSPWPPTR